MGFLVLSNNPALEEQISGIPVRQVEGGLEQIYEAIEDALQHGFELVSSPIPPNVPLIRSPYRSVILREMDRKYDVQGILVLEKARERSLALGTRTEERIMEDLRFLNKDHILRAIAELRELEDQDKTLFN